MKVVINHESFINGFCDSENPIFFAQSLQKVTNAIKKILKNANLMLLADIKSLLKVLSEIFDKDPEYKSVLTYKTAFLAALQKHNCSKVQELPNTPLANNIAYISIVGSSTEPITDFFTCRLIEEKIEAPEKEILLFFFPKTLPTNYPGFNSFIRIESLSNRTANFYLNSSSTSHKHAVILGTDCPNIFSGIEKFFSLKELSIEDSLIEKIETSKLFFDWLSYDWQEWVPLKNILPHKELSNLLCTRSSFDEMKDDLKCRNKNERNAVSEKMFKAVAIINGYQYNQTLSSINSTNNKKRIIFSSEVQNEKCILHLSLDMEKFGVFEVCSYEGEHLGEYSFDGKLTKKAANDHNIKLHP